MNQRDIRAALAPAGPGRGPGIDGRSVVAIALGWTLLALAWLWGTDLALRRTLPPREVLWLGGGGFAALTLALALGLAWSLARRQAVARRDLDGHAALLQGLLDGSTDALVAVDAEGRVRLFGAAAEALFGREAVDVLGRPLAWLMPGAPALSVLAEHPRSAVWATRADGRRVPCEVLVRAVPGDGEIRFVASLRDGAAGQRDEEARGATRRADEARASAERADQCKTQYLAAISHEIRTPLNAIVGLSRLLLRERSDRRVVQIDTAARHLLDVVGGVLDLARIESGRLAIEPADFALPALFDGVLSMVRATAERRGLLLRCDLIGAPVWLHGDATRLRQVLLNFAANAVAYADRGSVCLRAVAAPHEAGGLLLRLEVHDEGPGIAPALRERLFEPFVRGEEVSGSIGSGLGLSLSRELARLMGGDAGAAPSGERGTCFWCTARVDAGRSPAPPLAHRLGAESLLRARHAGRRVLVAEDNPVNLEVTKLLLEDAGLAVTTAEDGGAALLRLRESRHDLVLLDLWMPVLDGPGTVRGLRELPGYRHTPVVALSAGATSEDRDRCIAAGMDDYLAKPVPPEQLFECVLRRLDEAGVAGA